MNFIAYETRVMSNHFLYGYLYLFWGLVSFGIFKYRLYINMDVLRFNAKDKKFFVYHKHVATIKPLVMFDKCRDSVEVG